MKTVCIYHSVDLDGWMSAAIVKHWWIKQNTTNNVEINIRPNGLSAVDNNSKQDSSTITFIDYNYGQPIPDLSEYDKVIMCDISFSKDEMIKLSNKLVWIDHHISAILQMDTNPIFYNEAKGLRDTNFAACELTWQYFFPDEPIPEIVRLLGMYDSFRHKGTGEEQIVLEFQYGAREKLTCYEDCYEELGNANEFYTIKQKGRAIYQYLCTEAKQTYKNGFDIFFRFSPTIKSHKDLGFTEETMYKFICINKERFNPINFNIDYHKDGYDGIASFYYANGKYNFSLYNDNGLVDCSIIAKQFGGGGHKGAAGFVIDDINKILLK